MSNYIRLSVLILICFIVSSFTGKNIGGTNGYFAASITASNVSNITSSSATAGGESLSTDGTITEKGVYYKESSILSLITGATKVAATGGGTASFSVALTGLDPETNYFYVAYAIDADGEIYSANEIDFWTLAVSPSTYPATFSASANSSSSISITYESIDDFGGADGYIIIKTTGTFDFSMITDGVAPSSLAGVELVDHVTDEFQTSTDDISLDPETSYSYAIIPYNVGSDDATYNYFTGGAVPTASATTDPLAAPANLSASAITANGFDINWDDEPEADSYDWDVSEASDFSTTLASYTNQSTTSTGSAITESISSLSSGVTYYFRVRSVKGTFTSDYVTSSQVTTPEVPTGMSATNAIPDGFTLSWNAVTGATNYDVQISSSATAFSSNLIVGYNPINTTTNSLAVSDATKFSANTTYFFRVRAKNGGIQSSYSTITSATTAADLEVYLATTEPDLEICSGDNVSFYAFGATTYQFFVGAQLRGTNSTFSIDNLQNNDVVSVNGTTGASVASASLGPFTVHDLPIASLSGSNPSFFIEDDPVSLEDYITYSGGTLSVSGTGVAKGADGYKFYPEIAGEDNHEIIYSVKSPDGCIREIPMNIDVFAGALTLSGRYCSNLSTTTITVNLDLIPEGKIYQRLRFLHNGIEINDPSIYESTSNYQYTFHPAEAHAAGMESVEVQVIVVSVDECDSRHSNYPLDCSDIMDDPCHPDNPGPDSECTDCSLNPSSCSVCDPRHSNYPLDCSTVMNNPCHPDHPSYPGSCSNCDTRNPNYPTSCDAVMNNPCHPDNPSYPGSCSDCDTRNPNYPYSCDNVMNNPCHPDNPSYPSGCDIGPDPCYKLEAGRIIDCQLQRMEEARVQRIAKRSAMLMEYNKLAFPQLYALASDEEVFQSKETNIITPEIGEVTSLNEFYCANSGNVLLEGTFSGNFSGTNVEKVGEQFFYKPSEAIIPNGEAYVNDTIVYSYFDNGGCANSVEAYVKVYELPPSPIVDDIVLCQGDTPENFIIQNPVTGSSVIWYSDADLTTPVGSGTVFNSGLSTTSPGSATFYVTQGVNGCQSLSDTVSILVNSLPNGLAMHGLSNTTYCNDYQEPIPLIAEPAPVPGTSAAFIIGNAVLQRYDTISATVSDDGTLGVASFVPADFGIGVYKIHYRFINEKGCVNESATETVNLVNFKPTVDFGVSRIREGEQTFFKGDDAIIDNLSSAGQVLDSVFWDFGGEATASDGSNIDSLYRHQFSGAGVYGVTYSILTESFCSGQITKKVGIFPVIEVSDDNFYFESFEGASHGWIESEKLELGNASSWSLSTPQGDTIIGAASGANAWITNAGEDVSGNPNNSYNKSEDSWIEGPCFYINDLSRPVLSLKIWSDTEDGFDGAVVEYSIGDTTQWNTLGSIDEGLEWYNTQGLVGSPGNQSGASFGWSGKLHGDWTLAKFPLDEIHAEAGNKPVRFRVAFASTSDNPFGKTFDGFAFDDFSIESRNRVVLLEHFTNMSSTESRNEDSRLRTFVEGRNQEVIDIQYHTSFPGADPLNQFNKADPSARALHYAIAEVPRTVMDGIYGVYYKNEPFFRDSWGVNAYNTRALISAPFNINVLLGDDVSTTLEVTVEISKNTTAEPIEGNLIVQLAVVERQVTVDGNTYYNVVRQLLPNAAGNRLFGDWQTDDSRVERVIQTWNPAVEPDDSEFMIVASLYNEKSKEVYQAAFMSIPASKMPPMAKVTGVDDLLSKEGIYLFPNPTEKEINMLFPAPLNEEYTLTVYDLHGVEVYRGTVRRGADKATLNTETYSSGVYSIRLNSSTDQVIRRFVKK
ncbi:T9SS type A sorting domain-containing protein [Fulvivirga ulvae]|uniref:fibronectin type III domain-containing protein n=1 Tax=Fulvivirga ulvae TaxID=2904245 RepID=UPI001F20E61A|nr:T9SS type A sorting domain-containing protein [Fulvivirga ulvae]UII30629.1 T9SS type A sorting domain-containing protein [Fulvivirga ulvae]